ncbi:MAG TPA: DUF429 domain-containing protein [Acidimicrobiales bacterium]|jgi:predicted RNase H-like nuclease|nr:DUF429 domain-containing protein [Acidimicrobiales bacterium]
MTKLVGSLDGCRVGWVLVTTPADGNGTSEVTVLTDLAPLIADLDSGRLSAAAIDIPIGLSPTDSRPCDFEARKLIGDRRSSVFPAPVRGVLDAQSYEVACEKSRSISGKAISKQAFAILPKIREVDQLLTPERQQSFVEVHPEVSFTILVGRPMSHHKRRPNGRAERLAALRTVFDDVDHYAGQRFPGTQPDDVLDAFVAAWSARRWATRTHRQLGGDLDGRGLRMEMIA